MNWRLGEECVEAWLGTMGRVSLYGGLAVAVAWLICRVLPRMSPSAKSWVWRLVYLKLVLLFLCRVPIPVPLLPRADLHLVRAQGQAQAGTGRTSFAVSENLLPELGHRSTAPTRVGVRLTCGALFGVWSGSVILIVLRTIGSAVATRKTLREGRLLRDPRIEQESSVLSTRLLRKRTPVLAVHDAVPGPQVAGLLWPVVLFPASFVERFSSQEIRLVLAHELAHIRRRDLPWGWVRRVMHGLLFFHPLVWLSGEQAALADEIACDEIALRSTQATAADYARVLLKITEQNLQMRPSGPGLLAAEMSRGCRAMASRLQFLQQTRDYSFRIIRRRRWATLIGWLAAVVLLPWGLLTCFHGSGIRQIDPRYAVLGFKVSRGKSHTLSVRREVCRVAGFTLWRAVEELGPVQSKSPFGSGARSSSEWTANASAPGGGVLSRAADWLRKLGLKARLDTAAYSAGVQLREESCAVIVRFGYKPSLGGYENISAVLEDEQGEAIPLESYHSEVPPQSGELVKFWVVSPAPVTRSKFSLRLKLADKDIAVLRISNL